MICEVRSATNLLCAFGQSFLCRDEVNLLWSFSEQKKIDYDPQLSQHPFSSHDLTDGFPL